VGTAPRRARGTAAVPAVVVGRLLRARVGYGARAVGSGRASRTGRRPRLRPGLWSRNVRAVDPSRPEDHRLRGLNNAGTPPRDVDARAGSSRAAYPAGPGEAVRPARDHAPGGGALAGRADGHRAVPDARSARTAGADPPLHPVAARGGRQRATR